MRLTDLVTAPLLLLGTLILVALLLKSFGPKPLYVRRRLLANVALGQAGVVRRHLQLDPALDVRLTGVESKLSSA